MRLILTTIILTMLAQPAWANFCPKGTLGPELYCKQSWFLGIFELSNEDECRKTFRNNRDITVRHRNRHISRCSTTCERANEIFDNCLIAKLPSGEVDRDVKKAVRRICRKAGCNPSFLDKLKY